MEATITSCSIRGPVEYGFYFPSVEVTETYDLINPSLEHCPSTLNKLFKYFTKNYLVKYGSHFLNDETKEN